MWEKQPCRHQWRRRGRRWCRHSGAEIPLWTMVRQDALLQPTEAHRGGIIHMQPTAEQADVPYRGLWPCGEPTLEQFSWEYLWPCREESTLEHVCWQGFWPHVGSMLKQPLPEGILPVGAVPEGQFPMGRTLHWSGQFEERRVTMCDELTTTPFPVHLHCLGGGIQSEVESGKKGRREEGVFWLGFYYPILLLIINKFH